MPLSVIILAAGQGSRMKSNRPKVLHQVAGKSMLQHVVDTSKQLNPDQVIVVIGHHSELVLEQMQNQNLNFVEQTEQLGTGHAVQQCLSKIKDKNDVLVLYGDVPLISLATLKSLLKEGENQTVNILSFIAKDSTGYGRIVRDQNGSVCAIVEEKDANETEKQIKESNSGILLISGQHLNLLLDQLNNDNAQQEYYLTDVVKHAVEKSLPVNASICNCEEEVLGVNNQAQLANIEKIYRRIRAGKLMTMGAKLFDPERIDIRGTIEVGMDVEIDINCIFEGSIKLGNNVKIGANCVIKNCTISDNTTILPMCSLEDASIGEQVSIGPFSRIRPGTVCLQHSKVGNFVEVKKSTIGKNSKVSHLSYIGDTEMGKDVNIGAGTITCNYDGVNKFQTIIGDDVFVGSDSQLIAPVTIARGSTIGAGSSITKDTPADKLTLARAKQISLDGWQRPKRLNRE